MSQDLIIKTTNLVKRYKNLTAVNELNLNVYKGDVFGFLGPNGAGKSTTIRMLLTLISPTSGNIEIFGKPLKNNRKEILSKIGAIVEKPDFYKYLSAYKNLEILGKISGADVSKKSIMKILEMVGLEKRADSKVKTYSHGMKQRLGIAQALLHDPELIILDEPTTGLDPQGIKEIRELILKLNKDFGKTIFLSSHILKEVELICNRMIIINKGQEKVEGLVSDLLNKKIEDVSFKVSDSEKSKDLLINSNFDEKIKNKKPDEITLSLEKNEISEVNKLLVQNNIDVFEIHPHKSLEEYFLKITEEEGK